MTHVKKYLKKKKKETLKDNQKKKVLEKTLGEVSRLCTGQQKSLMQATQTVVQAAAISIHRHVSQDVPALTHKR